MRIGLATIVTPIIAFVLSASVVFCADSNFNTGIGRNGNTGLNISADTPGPLKYHLEFKPLGGNRQVSASNYDDTSKNFSTSVSVKCLDGGECSKDETYVRGVYIAGTEGGYAASKKFTLFCGSIQVVGEEKTANWDSTFYNTFADDFLTNGPSAGNCPSPTVTPAAATVTPISAAAVSPTSSSKTKLKTSPTKKPTEEPEDEEEDPEETPTPTPDEDEENSLVAGFTQNLPLIIAGLVLLGVIGYVLYQKNPKFNAFINKFKKKKDTPHSPQAV